MKTMYRYESVSDVENGREGFQAFNVEVYVQVFNIIKETSKGVWIQLNFERKKFILLSARNKWAYPTKKEALCDFIRRKDYHIKMLKVAYIKAKASMNKAETLLHSDFQ